MLSVFHLALFWQNKEKCYLLYSSYAFFSFLAYFSVVEEGFIATLSPLLGFDDDSKTLFTIFFNCIYFFFFAYFLNIKEANKKWFQIIVYPAAVLLIIAIVTFILFKFFGVDLYSAFKKLFVLLITIHTITSFYILTKLRNNLKYYIIFGGVVLFVCSIIGMGMVRENLPIPLSRKMGDFIYFAGLIVENLAFSMALGHKQKVIFDQKVAFQKDLVVEFSKNEQLKEKVSTAIEKRLTIENEQIKYRQEISSLRLSLLQSQMNPHFIFNALNSIKYYILENDTENAVDYLTKFSKIIRTILIASKRKDFTLSQEIHTLKLYVDIENLRFSGIDFQIESDPDIDLDNIKLPPMVLQPFIENAIIHGLATIKDKKIRLKVFTENNDLRICITDNGIGREQAGKNKSDSYSPNKSMGIEIARDMLKNYFAPQQFSVEYKDLYTDDLPSGTQVSITIPKPA